ncbi:MAG: hypothetical protein ACJAZS_000010 [Alteromonas naphthalenivorans]|jgi:hypothetical protein
MEIKMSKLLKVILGLSLLVITQNHAAAGKFMRFIKAPSVALGVAGSLGVYTSINYKKKIFVNDAKEQSIIQAQNTEIADQLQKIKDFCKKKGVNVNYPVYNSTTILKAVSVNSYNNDIIVILDDNFKPNSTNPQEEQDFVLGHECRHVTNNDESHRTQLSSTIPLGTFLTWRSVRLSGRGKILSTLASLATVTVGIKSYFKLMRYQESRADREASLDPSILEAGANFFENSYKKNQAQKQEIEQELPTEIKYFLKSFNDLLPQSHPHNLDRAKTLRAQAAQIRAEQENK